MSEFKQAYSDFWPTRASKAVAMQNISSQAAGSRQAEDKPQANPTSIPRVERQKDASFEFDYNSIPGFSSEIENADERGRLTQYLLSTICSMYFGCRNPFVELVQGIGEKNKWPTDAKGIARRISQVTSCILAEGLQSDVPSKTAANAKNSKIAKEPEAGKGLKVNSGKRKADDDGTGADGSPSSVEANGKKESTAAGSLMATIGRVRPLDILTSPLRVEEAIDSWSPLDVAKFEFGLCACSGILNADLISAKYLPSRTAVEIDDFFRLVYARSPQFEAMKVAFNLQQGPTFGAPSDIVVDIPPLP